MSDRNEGSIKSLGKTPLALEIEQVRDATLKAAAKRQHLPQPLFWSLFHSRIRQLKQEKHNERVIKQAIAQIFDGSS